MDYSKISYPVLKSGLLEYVKLYYPNSYNDFSEASVGMMLLELNAQVGDVLGHSMDVKTNEMFLDTARSRSSVIKLAHNLGYTSRGKTASKCIVQLSIRVPVDGPVYDGKYAFTLERGIKLQADNGVVFEILDDVDFDSHVNSVGTRDREIVPILNSANEITAYELRKLVVAESGESKVLTLAITSDVVKPFMVWKLTDKSVVDIRNLVSSTSSNSPTTEALWSPTNETWYNVEYLADQNVIYNGSETPMSGFHGSVEKKYTISYDKDGLCSIQFGGGVESHDLYASFLSSGISAVATTQMLNNKGLGVIPEVGTYLHCRYRTGGGTSSNVGVGKMTKILTKTVSYIPGLSEGGYVSSVFDLALSSLKATNVTPAIGGKDLESVTEIATNARLAYAAQNRCVTLADYISKCYTLPSSMASPFRVGGEFDRVTNVIVLHVLTLDENGKLKNTGNDAIFENVATYLDKYRMVSDVVEIRNGAVINIGVDFTIATNTGVNKKDVIYSCIESVKSFFDINRWEMGGTIYISQISDLLMSISGVKNVVSITVNNIFDSDNGYSPTIISSASNVESITSEDVQMPIRPNNNSITAPTYAMFEVRNPSRDIIGRVI